MRLPGHMKTVTRLIHLTPKKISVTVISIVRLTILLKIDLNSPDVDYNFVGFVSWSIAESNMAIVAGTPYFHAYAPYYKE